MKIHVLDGVQRTRDQSDGLSEFLQAPIPRVRPIFPDEEWRNRQNRARRRSQALECSAVVLAKPNEVPCARLSHQPLESGVASGDRGKHIIHTDPKNREIRDPSILTPRDPAVQADYGIASLTKIHELILRKHRLQHM